MRTLRITGHGNPRASALARKILAKAPAEVICDDAESARWLRYALYRAQRGSPAPYIIRLRGDTLILEKPNFGAIVND